MSHPPHPFGPIVQLPPAYRREPLPPNEHVIPFAFVTWDRLERGIWHHVRAENWRRRDRYELPREGALYMHPADRIDLLRSEPTRPSAWLADPKPFGFDLITTERPDGPYGARRGCPVLRLANGTEVHL